MSCGINRTPDATRLFPVLNIVRGECCSLTGFTGVILVTYADGVCLILVHRMACHGGAQHRKQLGRRERMGSFAKRIITHVSVTRAAGLMRALAALFALVLASMATLTPSFGADNEAALRDKYQSLAPQLANNPFHRPLHLDSTESPDSLKGDIYAVIDYPFATVNSALNDPTKGPANWCDVLILHLNIKYCHATTGSEGSTLNVNLGKKVEEKLSSTFRVTFDYRPDVTRPDYFRVDLSADKGPMSTKDYQIVLEAIAIDSTHTFIHLTYSYGYGTAGRIAMKTYLATIGSDKVGFSKSGDSGDYIGGVRGLVERNTMRYYLAIDAYLASLSTPAGQRLDDRLNRWFDATEQYPRQLHEVEKNDYIQMKHDEYQRQQTAR
jgi:hypothetical protein